MESYILKCMYNCNLLLTPSQEKKHQTQALKCYVLTMLIEKLYV